MDAAFNAALERVITQEDVEVFEAVMRERISLREQLESAEQTIAIYRGRYGLAKEPSND